MAKLSIVKRASVVALMALAAAATVSAQAPAPAPDVGAAGSVSASGVVYSNMKFSTAKAL